MSLYKEIKANKDEQYLSMDYMREIQNAFRDALEGYAKVTTYFDYNLGNGGYCDLNDEYFIKLTMFYYPKSIHISLIKKYEPNVIAGKVINEESLDIKDISIDDIISWVKNTCNKVLPSDYKE